MTKLMIAAAILAAAAGSALARTTVNDRPTLDYKTMADIQLGATQEQRLAEEALPFEKPDWLSRKPSNAPVILMAPSGGCPRGCTHGISTWQQFQLYVPAFLPLLWL
jgi:hypothetical protein